MYHRSFRSSFLTALGLFLAVWLLVSSTASASFAAQTTPAGQDGIWVTGDFHNHTWLTDGEHVEQDVVTNAFEKFGLDWLANSEHGGSFGRDPSGRYWDDPAQKTTIKSCGDPITMTVTYKDFPEDASVCIRPCGAGSRSRVLVAGPLWRDKWRRRRATWPANNVSPEGIDPRSGVERPHARARQRRYDQPTRCQRDQPVRIPL